jgi:hypothetical protein
LTVTRSPGRRGSLPEHGLVARNLRILELRLIDHMNFTRIGRDVGLTPSRVAEILRQRFGVDAKDRLERALVLHVPASSVPVVRDALTGGFQKATESLLAALAAGENWQEAYERVQTSYWLLLEVQKDEDTELAVRASRRKALIAQALTDHAELKRNMDDEDAALVCDLLMAAMPGKAQRPSN